MVFFISQVIRENILVYSCLQGNKIYLEKEHPPAVSVSGSVTPLYASAVSGGVTGALVSCFACKLTTLVPFLSVWIALGEECRTKFQIYK